MPAESTFMGSTSAYWTAIGTFVLAGVALVALIANVFLLAQTARAARAAESTSKVQAFLQLLERMEATRPDRAEIRRFILERRPWTELSYSELRSVDAVCRAFDILGYFDHRRLIDPAFVDHFYAIPLQQLYSYLGPYVDNMRHQDRRGPTHFWELVHLWERVKDVKHPAELGLTDWPANPRKDVVRGRS